MRLAQEIQKLLDREGLRIQAMTPEGLEEEGREQAFERWKLDQIEENQ